MSTHMADLGDGKDYTATNWTCLKYAGGGLFCLGGDIYNPANFITLITRWEAAAQANRSTPQPGSAFPAKGQEAR